VNHGTPNLFYWLGLVDQKLTVGIPQSACGYSKPRVLSRCPWSTLFRTVLYFYSQHWYAHQVNISAI